MKTYLYYCPRCEYERTITEIPAGSLGNCRGGYGRPIYHSACPNCGNLDAGCIEHDFNDESLSAIEVDKDIISYY